MKVGIRRAERELERPRVEVEPEGGWSELKLKGWRAGE